MKVAAKNQVETWNALDASCSSDGLVEGLERLLLLMLRYFNNPNFPACKMSVYLPLRLLYESSSGLWEVNRDVCKVCYSLQAASSPPPLHFTKQEPLQYH